MRAFRPLLWTLGCIAFAGILLAVNLWSTYDGEHRFGVQSAYRDVELIYIMAKRGDMAPLVESRTVSRPLSEQILELERTRGKILSFEVKQPTGFGSTVKVRVEVVRESGRSVEIISESHFNPFMKLTVE